MENAIPHTPTVSSAHMSLTPSVPPIPSPSQSSEADALLSKLRVSSFIEHGLLRERRSLRVAAETDRARISFLEAKCNTLNAALDRALFSLKKTSENQDFAHAAIEKLRAQNASFVPRLQRNQLALQALCKDRDRLKHELFSLKQSTTNAGQNNPQKPESDKDGGLKQTKLQTELKESKAKVSELEACFEKWHSNMKNLSNVLNISSPSDDMIMVSDPSTLLEFVKIECDRRNAKQEKMVQEHNIAIASYEREKASADAEIRALQKEAREYQMKCDKISQELSENLKTKRPNDNSTLTAESVESFKKLQKEVAELRQQLEELKRQKAQSAREHQVIISKKAQALDALREQISELHRKYARVTQEKEDIEADLETSKNSVKSLASKWEKACNKLEQKLEYTVKDCDAKMKKRIGQLDRGKDKTIRALQAERDEWRQKYEQAVNDYADSEVLRCKDHRGQSIVDVVERQNGELLSPAPLSGRTFLDNTPEPKSHYTDTLPMFLEDNEPYNVELENQQNERERTKDKANTDQIQQGLEENRNLSNSARASRKRPRSSRVKSGTTKGRRGPTEENSANIATGAGNQDEGNSTEQQFKKQRLRNSGRDEGNQSSVLIADIDNKDVSKNADDDLKSRNPNRKSLPKASLRRNSAGRFSSGASSDSVFSKKRQTPTRRNSHGQVGGENASAKGKAVRKSPKTGENIISSAISPSSARVAGDSQDQNTFRQTDAVEKQGVESDYQDVGGPRRSLRPRRPVSYNYDKEGRDLVEPVLHRDMLFATRSGNRQTKGEDTGRRTTSRSRRSSISRSKRK